MRNIVTYMAEEQRTFAESPFNPVDSLVFATLAYFNYEVAPGVDLASPDGVLLHDVVMLSDWEALTAHSWMEDAKDTEAFLHVLSASRRMRDVRASFYANERSEIVEKQFSAVTLTFPAADGEVAYLAYRGTDGSFAGWKEDFNLCFKEVIPSQCTAAAYLSGVASALACPLIVGGHSKGGNLAEYAALVADESAFERLRGVFNHDGPSFLDDPSPRIDDDRFHALLHKTVPESSAFGMILERRADYRVVRSSAMSVFQHEPFTWLTEDDDFVYQEALNPSAVFFDEALDAWLRSKAPDERERFIDTIYELFASTEAGTWSEFQTKLFANTRQLLGARSKLDAETKSFIWQTLGSLGGILKDETVKRFKPAPPTWLPRRRENVRPRERNRSMTASAYGRLTPRMAWQLAAPHTWPAAILPVLVAAAAAAVTSFSISATMVCVLLVICVLMQSAVNTFNDYYDYVKGADSADDNVDPTDAVLVYNNVNPRAALALAVGFLAAAFLLGAYVIWIAGWIPLAIGAAGAVVVVLYSAGKTPISYLPIGELVSGFVMGGLIPLACYQALSGTFDLRALLWAVPTILGVGLIMFTNNTCDVEKDVESGRRTLSVLLGRERARKLYHGVVYAWVAAIVVLVAAFFTNGLLVMPFMLLASYPHAQGAAGQTRWRRRPASAPWRRCVARTSHWARFYAAAILASGIAVAL